MVTDHEAIRPDSQRLRWEVCVVTDPCRTGTDRVAKVATQLTYEYVVNLQADEVLLHPDLLSDLIQPFFSSGAGMGTLKRKLPRLEDRENSSIVKVVTDQQGQALYFSRSAVPYWRDGLPDEIDHATWMHLGIYIFQKNTLQQFSELGHRVS